MTKSIGIGGSHKFWAQIFVGWHHGLKVTDKIQTVSGWLISDCSQDNNTPSQVVMLIYREPYGGLNNAQDTFVLLVDNLLVLVALASFGHKYFCTGVTGWKWRTKVIPWVTDIGQTKGRIIIHFNCWLCGLSFHIWRMFHWMLKKWGNYHWRF